mgnify:FL=1|tara:strand:+ start:57 stop:737 length:681 start_codon:yes stop_codon:yes gene_type:complete
MIHFPEIDFKNKNTLITVFILLILLFFLNNLTTKLLISILVLFFIINQYGEIKKNISQKIINQGNKNKPILNYNNNIENILKKIKKKYKKKSPYNFKEGMYYWERFIKTINTLENEELFHYNQYFDKAQGYLQKSVNLFQSLGTESNERKYIDAAKFNNFINSKDLRETTKLAKDLHQEGYLLLYNLSLHLNKKWKENPNTLNKPIVFDYPQPFDKNNSEHYDFYL